MKILSMLRGRGTSFAFHLGRAILRSPRLKMLARRVLLRVPTLRARLQAMMHRESTSARARRSNRVQDDADLSARTVRMLRALQHAKARKRQP